MHFCVSGCCCGHLAPFLAEQWDIFIPLPALQTSTLAPPPWAGGLGAYCPPACLALSLVGCVSYKVLMASLPYLSNVLSI